MGAERAVNVEKIIVFGMGKYFGIKKNAFMEKYNIVLFLDNKISQGTQDFYENIPVINPADLAKEDNTVIFLMSVRFISMWKQLCMLGVSPERLLVPFSEKPFFENDYALENCLDNIKFYDKYFECVKKDGSKVKIEEEDGWKSFLRKAYRQSHPIIKAISEMNTEPVSRQFGTERGKPIDRFYIEMFLKEHQDLVQGDVLEIEDNTYTSKFGVGRLNKSIVMDVSSIECGISFNANLETGEGIIDHVADCFILTQTLMYIFDIKSAAHNINRLLKNGGSALITCSGISQNSIRCMDNYGCYFNFNKDVFVKMFENERSLKVTETGSYGNVKTVSAHLNGLCCEDLEPETFEPNDKYYPLIVYAVVRKNG